MNECCECIKSLRSNNRFGCDWQSETVYFYFFFCVVCCTCKVYKKKKPLDEKKKKKGVVDKGKKKVCIKYLWDFHLREVLAI